MRNRLSALVMTIILAAALAGCEKWTCQRAAQRVCLACIPKKIRNGQLPF